MQDGGVLLQLTFCAFWILCHSFTKSVQVLSVKHEPKRIKIATNNQQVEWVNLSVYAYILPLTGSSLFMKQPNPLLGKVEFFLILRCCFRSCVQVTAEWQQPAIWRARKVLSERFLSCPLPVKACDSNPLKVSCRDRFCFSDQFTSIKYLFAQMNVNHS